MLVFDYRCPECNNVYEEQVGHSEQKMYCRACEQATQKLILMRKLPAATRTTFKFADKSGMKR